METLIVGLVLAVAVLFLARRVLASVRSARAERDGCGSGCGCTPAAGRVPKGWDEVR